MDKKGIALTLVVIVASLASLTLAQNGASTNLELTNSCDKPLEFDWAIYQQGNGTAVSQGIVCPQGQVKPGETCKNSFDISSEKGKIPLPSTAIFQQALIIKAGNYSMSPNGTRFQVTSDPKANKNFYDIYKVDPFDYSVGVADNNNKYLFCDNTNCTKAATIQDSFSRPFLQEQNITQGGTLKLNWCAPIKSAAGFSSKISLLSVLFILVAFVIFDKF